MQTASQSRVCVCGGACVSECVCVCGREHLYISVCVYACVRATPCTFFNGYMLLNIIEMGAAAGYVTPRE